MQRFRYKPVFDGFLSQSSRGGNSYRYRRLPFDCGLLLGIPLRFELDVFFYVNMLRNINVCFKTLKSTDLPEMNRNQTNASCPKMATRGRHIQIYSGTYALHTLGGRPFIINMLHIIVERCISFFIFF